MNNSHGHNKKQELKPLGNRSIHYSPYNKYILTVKYKDMKKSEKIFGGDRFEKEPNRIPKNAEYGPLFRYFSRICYRPSTE